MDVNILLFDDFETLDAFGVASVFGMESGTFRINYLSVTGNIVNSAQGVKVWTEPVDAEHFQGFLVLPGGRGARRLLYQDPETLSIIKRCAERSQLCMMIANGSALLAQTGLLFRRKIAECKTGENWKRMFLAGVYEVPDASWVADGKYYSSANSVQGIAMSLNILADQTDLDLAERAARVLGFEWNPEDEAVYQ